jgi:hypothetical protein
MLTKFQGWTARSTAQAVPFIFIDQIALQRTSVQVMLDAATTVAGLIHVCQQWLANYPPSPCPLTDV